MTAYTIRSTTEGDRETWAFKGTAMGAMKFLRRTLRASDYTSDGVGDVTATGDVLDVDGNVVCEVAVTFTDADPGESMVVADTTVTWVQP